MEAKKFYYIVLPVWTNNGLSTEKARTSWEAVAADLAGGWTKSMSEGAWKSKKGVVKEPVLAYSVACTPEVLTELIERAKVLYPDQECFFVAELGAALFFERTPLPKEPEHAAY